MGEAGSSRKPGEGVLDGKSEPGAGKLEVALLASDVPTAGLAGGTWHPAAVVAIATATRIPRSICQLRPHHALDRRLNSNLDPIILPHTLSMTYSTTGHRSEAIRLVASSWLCGASAFSRHLFGISASRTLPQGGQDNPEEVTWEHISSGCLAQDSVLYWKLPDGEPS